MALRVLRARIRHSPFAIYDGLLSDPNAIESIAQTFSSQFTFSPSQLETYIACPFQFFSKYVLKLETADDRDELDEDFTTRGSRLHDILEQLETQLIDRRAAGELLDDQALEHQARIALNSHMESDLAHATDVEAGLEEIERLRLGLVVDRYVAQSRNYLDDPQMKPLPHRLEVAFGDERSGTPCLEIGGEANTIRVRGKIDRIDLIDSPEGRTFRVIDYKSGSVPSQSDVRAARLLQLPLYAMAVERVILDEEQIPLRDVGYWDLKKDGFRAISFSEWQEVQAAVESYVTALVDRLRHGAFVVESQADDCESYCDFRAICRIRQVRAAGKHYDQVSPPELAISSARGGRKRRDSPAIEAASNSSGLSPLDSRSGRRRRSTRES
jgi:ATP-dependent helicase/nuclease subunit B